MKPAAPVRTTGCMREDEGEGKGKGKGEGKGG
jgi:hypothetical protein